MLHTPVFSYITGGSLRLKILNILIAVLFFAGAGVLAYPAVSNWWNQRQQDQIAEGYAKTVDEASEEEIRRMWEEAEAYNQNLILDEIIIDPFDQVVNRKVDGDYENTLNPQQNGVMGTLEIPGIGVYLPISHGTGEEVLQKAVGHLEQSSLPVGGEGTHAVLTGHRGLPSAKLFTDLDEMEEGDVFYLHILDETLAYQVDQITVVEPDNLQDLAIEAGKDYVTLVTCTPYGINSHRLLVRGVRIPYEEKEEGAQEAKAGAGMDWLPYAAAGAVLFAGIVIYAYRKRRGNQNESKKNESNKSESNKSKSKKGGRRKRRGRA